jgi:hypothetical protein
MVCISQYWGSLSFLEYEQIWRLLVLVSLAFFVKFYISSENCSYLLAQLNSTSPLIICSRSKENVPQQAQHVIVMSRDIRS